uniref:Astakine n=1 Tax=Aceria tosichella TaxID=561515 RepID=A0A6G1SQD8_9ACAR
MRRLLLITIFALIPILAFADLMDNQIEDQHSGVPLGYSYSVQSCRSCGSGECHVMGMQRFSEPICESLGGVGSPCRMWQEPENKTLHFPSSILLCDNVYMQFCPCGPGLVCEEAECRPRTQRMVATGNRDDVLRHIEREERDSFGENKDEMPIAFEPNRSKFSWAVARFRH